MTAEERSWLGDPAAESRRENMRGNAAALAASVSGARPFPEAAAKVLTLTAGQNFDVPALVAVLESDVALATRILRLVNSPGFGLRTRCASVKQAVPMLGSEGVRRAAIAGSVLTLFPGNGMKAWRELHSHATLVGGLCRHLAPQWGIPGDEMFTAAFLHDIGKWIFLEREEGYPDVLEAAADRPEATLEEERARFGFDHAELAEHLLSAWGIPDPIPRIAGLHHDPTRAYSGDADSAVRVALIRMADHLAHSITTGKEPDFEALAKVEPFTYLGLSAESVVERFGALALLFVDDRDEDSEESSARRSDWRTRTTSARSGSKGHAPRHWAGDGRGVALGLSVTGLLGSLVAYVTGHAHFVLPLVVGLVAAAGAGLSLRRPPPSRESRRPSRTS